MKIKTYGYLILLLAIFFSSLTPLAYVFGSTSNPIELTFYISLVGTIGSFILLLLKGKQGAVIENLKDIGRLWPFAFVGISFAIQTLIFSYTTHYISASLLSVIYRSWPLILILIAPAMLRERTTKYDLLAVSIGFLGMAIALISNSPLSIPIVILPFAGLVLFAAIIDAVTGVFQRSYKYEIMSTLFLYNLFALIAVSLFLPFSGVSLSFNLASNDIFAILFLGLIQNIILTFLFTSAIRMVKLPVVANVALVVPFVTIVLSYLILHEPVEPAYLIIAFSVLIGLLTQKLKPRTSNYISRTNAASTLPTIYDVTSTFVNTKNKAIYDQIKVNGKVLAFYKPIESKEVLEKHILAINQVQNESKKCFILTNKSSSTELHPRELEFIKEITGHEDTDLLILGIGNSDDVESSFAKLQSKISEV